eukprot:g6153.t1
MSLSSFEQNALGRPDLLGGTGFGYGGILVEETNYNDTRMETLLQLADLVEQKFAGTPKDEDLPESAFVPEGHPMKAMNVLSDPRRFLERADFPGGLPTDARITEAAGAFHKIENTPIVYDMKRHKFSQVLPVLVDWKVALAAVEKNEDELVQKMTTCGRVRTFEYVEGLAAMIQSAEDTKVGTYEAPSVETLCEFFLFVKDEMRAGGSENVSNEAVGEECARRLSSGNRYGRIGSYFFEEVKNAEPGLSMKGSLAAANSNYLLPHESPFHNLTTLDSLTTFKRPVVRQYLLAHPFREYFPATRTAAGNALPKMSNTAVQRDFAFHRGYVAIDRKLQSAVFVADKGRETIAKDVQHAAEVTHADHPALTRVSEDKHYRSFLFSRYSFDHGSLNDSIADAVLEKKTGQFDDDAVCGWLLKEFGDDAEKWFRNGLQGDGEGEDGEGDEDDAPEEAEEEPDNNLGPDDWYVSTKRLAPEVTFRHPLSLGGTTYQSQIPPGEKILYIFDMNCATAWDSTTAVYPYQALYQQAVSNHLSNAVAHVTKNVNPLFVFLDGTCEDALADCMKETKKLSHRRQCHMVPSNMSADLSKNQNADWHETVVTSVPGLHRNIFYTLAPPLVQRLFWGKRVALKTAEEEVLDAGRTRGKKKDGAKDEGENAEDEAGEDAAVEEEKERPIYRRHKEPAFWHKLYIASGATAIVDFTACPARAALSKMLKMKYFGFTPSKDHAEWLKKSCKLHLLYLESAPSNTTGLPDPKTSQQLKQSYLKYKGKNPMCYIQQLGVVFLGNVMNKGDVEKRKSLLVTSTPDTSAAGPAAASAPRPAVSRIQHSKPNFKKAANPKTGGVQRVGGKPKAAAAKGKAKAKKSEKLVMDDPDVEMQDPPEP